MIARERIAADWASATAVAGSMSLRQSATETPAQFVLRITLAMLDECGGEASTEAVPPKPYRCPVCGSGDANRYLRCNRPDCTDGRDPRTTTQVAK